MLYQNSKREILPPLTVEEKNKEKKSPVSLISFLNLINKKNTTTEKQSHPYEKPTSEEILEEAKNLPVQSMPNNNEEECSLCQNKEKQMEELNTFLSTFGYSSWRKYSAPEQYQQAKTYFALNKDSLTDEEEIVESCNKVVIIY